MENITAYYKIWTVFLYFIIVTATNNNLVVDSLTTIRPLMLNVSVGERVTFKCKTTETVTYHWQWFKVTGNDVKNIAQENKFALTGYNLIVDNKISQLNQLNVSIEDDQSRYYCQYGAVSKMATLTINGADVIDIIYPRCDVNVTIANTEKMVIFTCSAISNNPPPSLKWIDSDNQEYDSKTFICQDDNYCSKLEYVLSVNDERKYFNCTIESYFDELQSCFVDLRIPPNVVLSTKQHLDLEMLEIVCTAETPWRISKYEWFLNNEPIISSQLQFHLIENGRKIFIENAQLTAIEIKCNVSTSTGLIGGDVLYLENINKRCDMLIISFSFGAAIVIAFIFGFCLSKLHKSKNYSPQNVYTFKDTEKFKKIEEDVSMHEYETVLMGNKRKPPDQNKYMESGYTEPGKTKASKYKEIKTSSIDLEYSEYLYMSTDV